MRHHMVAVARAARGSQTFKERRLPFGLCVVRGAVGVVCCAIRVWGGRRRRVVDAVGVQVGVQVGVGGA